MSYTEIIRKGLANGDSYEVINKKLKEAGADFSLVKTDKSGWTEQEMKEGFIPATGEVPDARHLTDLMMQNEDYAGKDIDQWCAEGHYRVSYDAEGHAIKAVKI